ncbi:SCO family protein [Alloyangia pacifica]|uniref:Protein SCO1/2 n=1 Tax=Alloyangia pacifica TaxID=311180 RepID=A0A1I6U3G1_9RHOB|nr:SCO family protein [Alloyangia pacifica]SDH36538.1 protein SCO1/2 [Alloyangia pacifica]SFS95908.1 protein SCO1/2 [Alloyangia pacifica]
MKPATLVAIVAAGGLLALCAGIWVATQWGRGDDAFADCRQGVVAGGAGAIGGPFELVLPSGETVTDAEVITEPTLLYFGYTFCPDICPLDNIRNADAVDLLAEAGYSATPVMISIDPARDTPEVMGQYASNIHEKMIGLTGTEAQIAQAAKAYRAYYKKNDDDPEFYSVDHSAFTYLVLPGTGFAEFFRRDVSPEQLAERAGCFIDHM